MKKYATKENTKLKRFRFDFDIHEAIVYEVKPTAPIMRQRLYYYGNPCSGNLLCFSGDVFAKNIDRAIEYLHLIIKRKYGDDINVKQYIERVQ